MSDEWDWEFTTRADGEFADLDTAAQRQLLDKLNEVVSDEFRAPPEYLRSRTSRTVRSGRGRIEQSFGSTAPHRYSRSCRWAIEATSTTTFRSPLTPLSRRLSIWP